MCVRLGRTNRYGTLGRTGLELSHGRAQVAHAASYIDPHTHQKISGFTEWCVCGILACLDRILWCLLCSADSKFEWFDKLQ